MANRNLSRVILLGGLSVNLNHLKSKWQRGEESMPLKILKPLEGGHSSLI